MEQTSSKRLVRILLRLQDPVLVVWRLVPRTIAFWLLRVVRHGENAFSFGLRYLCVWRLARHCGGKVIIFPSVHLKHVENLSLGSNVSVHEFTYIDAFGGVTIGNDVAIAHGCSILSSDHRFDDIATSVKSAPVVASCVLIESDVWLGCGVRVLGGAIIRNGAVVGAGAVVTGEIPSRSVAVGVPARVMRQRKGRG